MNKHPLKISKFQPPSPRIKVNSANPISIEQKYSVNKKSFDLLKERCPLIKEILETTKSFGSKMLALIEEDLSKENLPLTVNVRFAFFQILYSEAKYFFRAEYSENFKQLENLFHYDSTFTGIFYFWFLTRFITIEEENNKENYLKIFHDDFKQCLTNLKYPSNLSASRLHKGILILIETEESKNSVIPNHKSLELQRDSKGKRIPYSLLLKEDPFGIFEPIPTNSRIK